MYFSSSIFVAWANPAGGPSQDDRTSNAWKWVYPLGFGLIVFGMFLLFRGYNLIVASLVSRYRNKDKNESDEETSSLETLSKKDRSARMFQAMERLDFVTKSKDEQGKMSRDYDSEY
jgi:hypothetical protein